MHVWKSSVISLTSYFQDIFQIAKPIPDYLQTFQTFPDLTLIPDISGRRGNPAVFIETNVSRISVNKGNLGWLTCQQGEDNLNNDVYLMYIWGILFKRGTRQSCQWKTS